MPARTVAEVVVQLQSPKSDTLAIPPYSGGSPVGLALAVESMKRHMTDEGWQIVAGLQHAGYAVAGHDLDTESYAGAVYVQRRRSLTDVQHAVDFVRPGVVVMQDKREWDVSAGDFRDPAAAFRNVEWLRERDDIFKVTVLKDAHQRPPYHMESAEEIGCHAWIVYYHPRIVKHVAPYVREEHLVRTYHSVDASVVPVVRTSRRNGNRKGTLLSGAKSAVYPLRQKLFHSYRMLPLTDAVAHPGYHRNGCATESYLQLLSQYQVAICTSSVYGYALRKIVEATACGCIVLTDLPADDVLPHIDGNLVRITPDFNVNRIGHILHELYKSYDSNVQAEYAEKAKAYYDYRAVGLRLADDIERLRLTYGPC